jgi:hypothetical protein
MTSKFNTKPTRTSQDDLSDLPPATAKFLRLARKLAARKKGCTLAELAERAGYTLNSTSHRLSHLRAAGYAVPDFVRSNAAEQE